jgi:CheY-like chemotaxis protein
MRSSVLVVDDDSAFRGLATRVLTGWGHIVIGEAGTVADAVRRAVELEPDVALVDVGLPDGDGFALARRLVVLPHPPRVVLVSASADDAQQPAACRAGAVALLPKELLADTSLRLLLEGR